MTNKQTCKGNGVVKIKKYSSNTGKYHAPAVNKKVNDTLFSCLISDKPLPIG